MPSAGVPYGHSTPAIFGENLYDDQGVGVYGRGNAFGAYCSGTNGVLGIAKRKTATNGACIWGYPTEAPDAGKTIYSGLFQDNDLAGVIGLADFGGGFTTKPFNTPSDRRLKTDIRNATVGLNAILQLRPKQYRYIASTPYNFPKGEQEGFIAQELEEVLPGLVEDLVFPKSLDPKDMAASGTETYKGINYTGLIPVITKAIQELNDKIEAQAAIIDRLDKELKACSKKD